MNEKLNKKKIINFSLTSKIPIIKIPLIKMVIPPDITINIDIAPKTKLMLNLI